MRRRFNRVGIRLGVLVLGAILVAGTCQADDQNNRYQLRVPATLTVLRSSVTRQTYVDFVRPQAKGFESGPDRGMYGPRHGLAALAVYALEGDPRLGEGLKRTLRYYGDWVRTTIEQTGGVFSMEGATLCGFYFREFRKRGAMTPADEIWARDLLLTLRKYQYAWQPGDGLWRGSHHRAQAQGTANALAAFFYPLEPDAHQWAAYAENVRSDWWDFGDIGINDTGYYFSSLATVLRGAELMGDTRVFTAPQSRPLFDRLRDEVTPDGVVIPYGSNDGYNAHVGTRIFALELASHYTRDGRYRWVAHRLMNHLQTRTLPGYQLPLAYDIEEIALTSLICDDSVAPLEPDGGSKLLTRKEIIRLSDATAKALFPDAGGIDSGMYMTQTVMPGKLVFRSGWKPGDLYLLAECYARHDPLNPTAILGMERYSAAFTEMRSDKSESRGNAVRISDVSNAATFTGRKGITGEKVLPWGWTGMETKIPVFKDRVSVTHAMIEVSRYMGYEATQKREFLFVKNRFVLVRDETVFNDSFHAKVGPAWTAQHFSDVRGSHWINAWFTDHFFQAVKRYDVPPWDLLIYYAPKTGAVLTTENPSTSAPAQAALGTSQYAWTGQVQPGTRLQFAHILLPHAPEADGRALAGRITVLMDEPGVAAFAVREGSVIEIVVLNDVGRSINFSVTGIGMISTDAHACYVKYSGTEIASVLLERATYLNSNGKAVYAAPSRADYENVGK